MLLDQTGIEFQATTSQVHVTWYPRLGTLALYVQKKTSYNVNVQSDVPRTLFTWSRRVWSESYPTHTCLVAQATAFKCLHWCFRHIDSKMWPAPYILYPIATMFHIQRHVPMDKCHGH